MKLERTAAELEHIRTTHNGMLKPEDVVAFATDPNTALHSHFEWDDTEAAREYRLVQARTVIRLIVTVIGEDPVPMRTYVSLPSDRVVGGGYRALQDVVNDESRRQRSNDCRPRSAGTGSCKHFNQCGTPSRKLKHSRKLRSQMWGSTRRSVDVETQVRQRVTTQNEVQ